MRAQCLIIVFLLPVSLVQAQTAAGLAAELIDINAAVTTANCSSDTVAALSHGAMNVFMADKTAYLNNKNGLSFFTNYLAINTAEGSISVTHSFQPTAHNNDEPIRQLFSIGFDMTIAGSYAKSFQDRRFENEIALSVAYKWLGRVRTKFGGCTATSQCRQQQNMNALRAVLVEQLKEEILAEEKAFLALLSPCSGDSAATIVRENFYATLRAKSEEKFAFAQAALLTATRNFTLIRSSWFSISLYTPLYFAGYTAAEDFNSPFIKKHPYPLALLLAHTRFWEGNTWGRLFVTVEGSVRVNNSKLSYGLVKLNYPEYKSLGGMDRQFEADNSDRKLYIGAYKNFITASIAGRFTYFPPAAHVGLSFYAEKSFGSYHFLNWKAGIPIILINNRKTPAVTLECFVLSFHPGSQQPGIGGTTAGLSAGIPFSRLMF